MSVSLQVSDREQWRVLSLSGRVDAFADKRVIAALQAAVMRPRPVVLDLSQCQFISLWALKALIQWSRELSESGGRLVLLAPPESIRRQLDVFVGTKIKVAPSWEPLDLENFYRLKALAQPFNELSDSMGAM